MAAPDSTIPQSAIKDAAHAANTASDSAAANPAKLPTGSGAAEMSQVTTSRPDLDSVVSSSSSIPVSPMEGTFPRSQGDSEPEKADVSPVSASSNIPPTTSAATAVAAARANAPPAPALKEEAATAPPLARTETAPAIGPATDTDAEAAAALAPAGAAPLAVPITLLLTTGARHPFRLDAKYLAKRSITAQDNNPLNISVYTMKELILRDWRTEWEARPASPSSIRLISFGRLLDDKSTLGDCKLSPDQPNVVHMTIKPSDIDDEGGFTKGSRSEANRSSPGCKCCLIM